MTRLSGGASRETWAFDLFDALDGSTRPLILQRVRAGPLSATFTMAGEAGLLAAAAGPAFRWRRWWRPATTRPCWARPSWSWVGSRGRPSPGASCATTASPPPAPALVDQCASALAGIHRLGAEVAPHLRADDPVQQLRGLLDALGQPHPAFELGLRWLDDHRPPPVEPGVVHGDFRLGNLMVDDHGPGRGARLGAGPSGRSHRGPGLVVRAGLALRFRAAGGRSRPPTTSSIGAYERGHGHHRRPRAPALVGGAGHAALGADLRAAGLGSPVGGEPIRRTGRHRSTGL